MRKIEFELLLYQMDEITSHQSLQLDVARREELLFVYQWLVVEHVAHQLIYGVDEELVGLAIQFDLMLVENVERYHGVEFEQQVVVQFKVFLRRANVYPF